MKKVIRIGKIELLSSEKDKILFSIKCSILMRIISGAKNPIFLFICILMSKKQSCLAFFQQ